MGSPAGLLGGGSSKRSFRDRLRGGLAGFSGNPAVIKQAGETEDRNRLSEQQRIMGESFSILRDIDSGNIEGAKQRAGTISVDLQKRGLDPSNFMNLDEMLSTDPKAARQMIVDAGKDAVTAGTLDIKNNPQLARLLGMGKKEDLTFKPVMTEDGIGYEVRSYTGPDGDTRTVARDGTDLTGQKLHGPNSLFFKKKIKEMEDAGGTDVKVLSTYGKVLFDQGLKPGTPEFQDAMQKEKNRLELERTDNPRERSRKLNDDVTSTEPFKRYTTTILQAESSLDALRNADTIAGKITLAQRTVSEIYNADTRAASEIDRFVSQRGLATTFLDWQKKLGSGTATQATLDSLELIANDAIRSTKRARQSDILGTLLYSNADFKEYQSIMRRYGYPVYLNKDEWKELTD